MSAGWVAGSVRARALARRRLGTSGTAALARSPSLPVALSTLSTTPYAREVHAGQDLAEAQHAVAATLLWHVRVLAGWLPPEGAELMRVLTGYFEIANVDELLQRRGDRTTEPEFHLGSLATAWPQLSGASSLPALRQRLAESPWGDPGGDDPKHIQTGMRLAWAARVATAASDAMASCAAGAAILVARERFASTGPAPSPATLSRARPLIGAPALVAGSLPEYIRRLPRPARWALTGVTETSELWRAEAKWWARVSRDGFALLARSGFTAAPVLGALAVLAVDAWRVRAALELAARGGGSLEVLDAVA